MIVRVFKDGKIIFKEEVTTDQPPKVLKKKKIKKFIVEFEKPVSAEYFEKEDIETSIFENLKRCDFYI